MLEIIDACFLITLASFLSDVAEEKSHWDGFKQSLGLGDHKMG